METWRYAVAVGSAFVAGAINSIAGGGTLVSFPALVRIAGLDPLAANVTSTIALFSGSVGGFWGHREDLAGTRAFAQRLLPPSLLGGGAGAGLLLLTPPGAFAALVPWLILGATLLLALQGPIGGWIERSGGHAQTGGYWAAAMVFQFLVGLYGGFFGAGIGILMLAALGLLGLRDIHQMNGLKNLLALSINAVAVVFFVFSPYVLWPVALSMAAGAACGGMAGAALAHRVGRRAVRWFVVSWGLGMAAWSFLAGH